MTEFERPAAESLYKTFAGAESALGALPDGFGKKDCIEAARPCGDMSRAGCRNGASRVEAKSWAAG